MDDDEDDDDDDHTVVGDSHHRRLAVDFPTGIVVFEYSFNYLCHQQ